MTVECDRPRRWAAAFSAAVDREGRGDATERRYTAIGRPAASARAAHLRWRNQLSGSNGLFVASSSVIAARPALTSDGTSGLRNRRTGPPGHVEPFFLPGFGHPPHEALNGATLIRSIANGALPCPAEEVEHVASTDVLVRAAREPSRGARSKDGSREWRKGKQRAEVDERSKLTEAQFPVRHDHQRREDAAQ